MYDAFHLIYFHCFKSSEVEPILNPQYWEVLADVLSDPGDTPIAPITSRFTIAPSLLAIFLSYRSLSTESVNTLFFQVLRSLTILWPRSTHNLDVLSELFWASVSLITEHSHNLLDSHVIETVTLIWSSLRHSFGIASANQKKKACLHLCIIAIMFSYPILDFLLVFPTHQGVVVCSTV